MVRKKTLKKRSIFFITLAFMGMGLLLVSQSACAFHHSERRYGTHHSPYRGKGFAKFAPDHRVIWAGKKRYPNHSGVYHRRVPSSSIVVNIPLGAVFLNLPTGYKTFVIGGRTYYRCGDVVYQKVPSGYIVVQEPLRADIPTARVERISVTADQLYVRTGPGRTYSVMARVSYGVVLAVRGHAPGWFYVELPNKSRGWIMSKFTSPLSALPKG